MDMPEKEMSEEKMKELLGNLAVPDDQNDPWEPDADPAEMTEALKKAAEAFVEAPKVFTIGDIVTPIEGARMRGRGRPMYVVGQRLAQAVSYKSGGSCDLVDITVAVLLHGQLNIFRMHSSQLEIME